MDSTSHLSGKVAGALDRKSGLFLLAIVVATALLAVPMVAMPPNETASSDPGGRVYELQGAFNFKLPPRVHSAFFIAEVAGGDILTAKPLWELYQNVEELRRADEIGDLAPSEMTGQPYLFNGFDVDHQQPIIGVFTLADAVQEGLSTFGLSLENATDEQVKLAIHSILADPRTEGLKDTLSQEATKQQGTALGQAIDYWTSPALVFGVFAENEKLGGGTYQIGAAGGSAESKEGFNRKVQAALRGEQLTYELWGIAIDAELESQDEVGTAVPYILATFIMVLVVVGISLRSLRVVLLTGVGLVAMIVWLKGLSNLIGLASSTVLDFIVPIAMISLGADFVIHAVSRYREEGRVFPDPRNRFRVGMASVLGALALAMATDVVAFLANVSADIETVVGFGIGAGLAIVSAFVILGLAVPVALMRLDAWRTKKPPVAGDVGSGPSERKAEAGGQSLAGLVVGLARWRWGVLLVAGVVTAAASYFAFQLEATFEVKDFFKSDSDFVIGLDKLDEHVGGSAGESAIIYIEGDLTDPALMAAIRELIDSLAADPYVGKNDLGEANLQARSIFSILDQAIRSDYARQQIEKAAGVSLSAIDGLNEFDYGGKTYKWPASREGLAAIYDYAIANGIPLNEDQKIYDAAEVAETLFHDPSGTNGDATAIVVGIPGTRDQAKVHGSRETLGKAIQSLRSVPSVTDVGLTGSPYTRQRALDATTDGLQRALPLAIAGCLIVSIVAMRSVRLGVVTVIPIGLVVAWLYAFMYLFGFGLNFVTATIAAVSIGVGVDFAIHMTQRFREELAKAGDREQALFRASQGTGVALLASAATSILGFTIMAFAPMPLFASYGILTAVMIFLAAAASLLVLPSLLLLVTPSGAVETKETRSAV